MWGPVLLSRFAQAAVAEATLLVTDILIGDTPGNLEFSIYYTGDATETVCLSPRGTDVAFLVPCAVIFVAPVVVCLYDFLRVDLAFQKALKIIHNGRCSFSDGNGANSLLAQEALLKRMQAMGGDMSVYGASISKERATGLLVSIVSAAAVPLFKKTAANGGGG